MLDKKISFIKLILWLFLLFFGSYILLWNLITFYELNRLESDELSGNPKNHYQTNHDSKCYPPLLTQVPFHSDQIKIPKCNTANRLQSPTRNTLVESIWVQNGQLRIKYYPNFTASLTRCSLLPIKRLDDYMSTYEEPIEDVHDGYQVQTPMFKVLCQPRENLDLKTRSRWNDKALQMQQSFFICGSYPAKPKHRQVDHEGFNVLLLGLDSVSLSSANRYLNKTMQLLNTLNATLFKVYNVIGDGTTVNLLALLTGHLESELPEARRSHKHPSTVKNERTVIDSYPWLWTKFSEHGYATHYIEDTPRWGTFQNRLLGFGSKATPTDEYGRPCLLAAYQEEKFTDKKLGCTGQRLTHHVLIESMTEFFSAYHPQPRFSLTFLSELFHENVAYVQMLDDDLAQLISQIDSDDKNAEDSNPISDSKPVFANTILILFADHGPRMGKVRQSIQGKLQERLPLLFIYLPRKFQEKWPQATANLRLNHDKLVTLFDIHETLNDLLKRQSPESTVKPHQSDNQESYPIKYGQTLFEPVSEHRTCQEAQIQPHWCVCLHWELLSSSEGFVSLMAKRMVEHINSLVKDFNQCARFTLDKIITAEHAHYPRQVVRFVQSIDPDGRIPLFADDRTVAQSQSWAFNWLNPFEQTSSRSDVYRIYMTLKPGPAHFEVIGRLDLTHKDGLEIRQISRLDLYEPLVASCMSDQEWSEIRPYCVCVRTGHGAGDGRFGENL